ncbi:phage holin family protein [Candidatus Nomurabacteria bacterium]|nr:phage holin family protein [Candidatus Nomurabacteria bacterium]
MKLILRLLLNAVILISVAYWLSGVQVDSFYVALITAIILGLVNAVIRPVLIILTLPITILTLGLFTLVVNGLLILFVASFVQGFSVDGLLTAIILSLIMWLASWISNSLFIEQ